MTTDLERARDVSRAAGRISISLIHRALGVGYAAASDLAQQLKGNAMPEMPPLAPREEPKDYITCLDAEIVIEGKSFPISIDICGRLLPSFPGSRETPEERGGIVVDRVFLEKNDISSRLPSEAMETITALVNERSYDE